MVAAVLDSRRKCDKQMNKSLFILIILLSVAAVPCEAQAPAVIGLESNVRYSRDQMIALFKNCAPYAALNTMLAIATTESSFHPYAISINSPQKVASELGLTTQVIELARQPHSKQEAILWMRWFFQHRISVSVGLLQINTDHAARFHLDPERLFDPCTNVSVGAIILAEAYAVQRLANHNDPDTLLRALSLYNTGNAQSGFSNGYVDRILKNARP